MNVSLLTDALPVPAVLHLIDDDQAFCRSLAFLLVSAGWETKSYASAEVFLANLPAFTEGGGALLVDIRMPRISGLELIRRLQEQGSPFPVLVMTGHGDVELAVESMKLGAYDFLQKPFNHQRLLDAVSAAVTAGLDRQAHSIRRALAEERLARLSAREHEVSILLARGLPNKAVGQALGISEKTVHVHRQHIMDKTETHSAAELARLVLSANESALD